MISVLPVVTDGTLIGVRMELVNVKKGDLGPSPRYYHNNGHQKRGSFPNIVMRVLRIKGITCVHVNPATGHILVAKDTQATWGSLAEAIASAVKKPGQLDFSLVTKAEK